MLSRTVLLYGRSLLLSLVAVSLAESPDLCVTQAVAWSEIEQLLAEGVPDVLVFELTDIQESHLLPLLFENPKLLLIGLDAECNRAMLLSGREAQPLTLNQIKELALREILPCP